MNEDAHHYAASCLLMRARRLARATTQIYVQEMGAVGLSVGQFSLLAAIGVSPGARAADLGPALDLEKSTVSREVAGLLREGLVEAVAIDGRSKGLRITAEGAARLKAARPAWSRAQARAEEALGELAPALWRRFPAE